MTSLPRMCLILGVLLAPSFGWAEDNQLTREILDESLQLGRQFLLNRQRPEGNFEYEYDLITGEIPHGDNQVRQSGALWAMALIHLDDPRPETRVAIKKGLDFFERHSQINKNGGRFIVYPGDRYGKTGTMALVSLALIDFLRAEKGSEGLDRWESLLQDYLVSLLNYRTETGLFDSYYDVNDGTGRGTPSPYFDGETLLALCKSWRYLGRSDLEDLIWESAESMQQIYVTEALKKDPDSSVTKGFFHWGCLSYLELFLDEKELSGVYGERCLDLAVWMIDVHKTLERTRNTAYAQEGILAAWQCADLMGDRSAKRKFEGVVQEGLYKLTTWQVGVSIQNHYLRRINPDPWSSGGVMNKKDDPLLRIDVTQHQMHAVLLARQALFESMEDVEK